MLSRRPRRGGGHPLEEASEVMVAETCGLKARHALHNTLSSTNAAFQTALCSGLRSGRRRHIQRVSGDCGTHPLPSLPYQRGNNVSTFGPSPCRSDRPKFLRSILYWRGGVPGERTFEGLRRLPQRRRAVYSVRGGEVSCGRDAYSDNSGGGKVRAPLADMWPAVVAVDY